MVLPFCQVIDWAYECNPGGVALHNAKVLSGVRIADFGKPSDLVMKPEGGAFKLLYDNKPKYLFSVKTASSPNKPEIAEVAEGGWPWSIKAVYAEGVLFHGPAFHAIDRLVGAAKTGASAVVKTAAMLHQEKGFWTPGSYSVDIPMLDAGLQLGVLWTEVELGKPSLPLGIKELQWHGDYDVHAPVDCRVSGKVIDNVKTEVDVEWVQAGKLVAKVSGVDLLTYDR